MKCTRRHRLTAVAVAVAALALPASALGHGSVYKDIVRAVATGDTPPIAEGDLVTTTRYVVSNHGNSYVLDEDNGRTTGGMIDYKRLPGAYRAQASVTTQNLIDQGGVGAQPHHTCSTAALNSVANIEQWQDKSTATPPKPEPFYGYVPFQEASSVLDDVPSKWIPLVQTLTGVDLTTVTDIAPDRSNFNAVRDELKARCEAVGGTFLRADAVRTRAEAFNSSTLLNATNPLNASLAAQAQQIALLQAANSGGYQGTAALQAEIAQHRTPLKVAVAGDLTVTVTGPAGRAVLLSASVRKAVAKALGLKATRLARTTVTIAPNGRVTVKLSLSNGAAKAIKAAKRAVRVTVTAASGDRHAASSVGMSR